MNNAVPRHPEAHTMAAFVEGKLAPDDVAAVAGHLRECADCRTVVSETARFEREEARAERKRPSAFTWRLAATAVLAAALITIPLLRWNERRNASPIAELIAAAPREHRLVEARLSAFPWAQLQAPPRGGAPPDPADLKLSGAAGDVLAKTRDERTPEARHAEGVAYLLIGRDSESIAALQEAANASSDKRVWNDLAAAQLDASEDHPSLLPQALAAADRAMKLAPSFAEAAFNRALILERMGIRDQARSAWQHYLELDPGSDWSNEARAHLRRLGQSSARFDPKLLASLPAETVVQRFPQEARTWGEGPLIAEWADAEAAGDRILGETKLSIPRALGKTLAKNREHLLEDAVAAIDRAAGPARAALIEGHRLYRTARIDYSRHKAREAETQFRRAASLFREGGSPMAAVAAYYAANATFEQNRGTEARDELLALLAGTDQGRTPALAAQIHWTLALVANSAGDWGSGVRESDAAAATFRSLGERQNAASVDSIAAHALELIGDSDLAWTRRLRAIEGICGAGDGGRCNSLLQDAATTLASVDRATAAVALIDATIDPKGVGDPALLASALAKRARVARQAGDDAGARASVAAALSAAGRIPDAALREISEMQIRVEDAALRRTHEPRSAVAALDRAASFFSDRQLRHLLPYVHLERARAFRSAGDDTAARAAYESVLQEIGTQQSKIRDANLRLTFLDTARQAIEETIELDLSRGRVADAFRMADRRQGLSETQSPAAVPQIQPGVAVIEYVVLPRKVVIFLATSRGIEVATTEVERGDLTASINTFNEKIRRRAPGAEIRVQAAALYAQLIAPVRARLEGVEELVFVPDRQLYSVPFAALYDEAKAHYLIEEFTIRFATAASSGASSADGSLEPAVVIADPPTARWRRLAGSRDEAERVATLHAATLISGEKATRARFIEGVEQSALIHFAGHADTDAGQSWGALLLASSEGDSGILGTTEITGLTLTRAPLVVLAACGTFRGDAIHVSGMSSLARAFLIAGARGVVGTLWEIDDDVAGPLFLEFHESLRAGASPARALQLAQLAMLTSTDARLQHPATWSPVELLTPDKRGDPL